MNHATFGGERDPQREVLDKRNYQSVWLAGELGIRLPITIQPSTLLTITSTYARTNVCQTARFNGSTHGFVPDHPFLNMDWGACRPTAQAVGHQATLT